MIIKAPCGAIEGTDDAYGTRYLGIPFAEPPVGALAFRDPVKKTPWSGTLQADTPGHNPVQCPGPLNPQDNSQDCLYLNVFVPAHAEGEKLPVMVWIYGGSWATGGAGRRLAGSDQLEYEPGKLSSEGHVIVVTFNYRLNAYGFLNFHALSDRFDLNAGLKDQILALSWVHENIASFSGDPENVTLFGQSAGAASILALLCIKEVRPMFAKTILQSGCMDHFWTYEEAEKNTVRFLKLLHIPADSPQELLEKNEEEVLDAVHRCAHILYPRGDIRCYFAPVVDGDLLPDRPKGIFDPTKPMLIGTVRNEADIIVANVPEAVLPFFQLVLPIHVKNGGEHYTRRISDALTQWIYRTPAEEVLGRMQAPAFAYEYALVLPSMAAEGLRAFHASEIPVLFGWDNPELFAGVEQKVACTGREMRRIWSRFAATGEADWSSWQKSRMVREIGE